MVWVLNLHVFISEVIALVVSRKARLACDSAVKHSIPESVAMLMRDSVVTLLASGPNPN